MGSGFSPKSSIFNSPTLFPSHELFVLLISSVGLLLQVLPLFLKNFPAWPSGKGPMLFACSPSITQLVHMILLVVSCPIVNACFVKNMRITKTRAKSSGKHRRIFLEWNPSRVGRNCTAIDQIALGIEYLQKDNFHSRETKISFQIIAPRLSRGEISTPPFGHFSAL